MLFKKTNKQDNWVVIPLRPQAKEVFARLFTKGKPKISNPEFNRDIQQIAKLAGIMESTTFSHKKVTKDLTNTKPKVLWIT